MHKLKAIFIMPYMLSMMALAGYSTYQLLGTAHNLGWLGVLLVSGPFMLWISRVMLLRDQPRTSANLPLLTLMGGAGVLVAFYANAHTQGGGTPLVLAAGGFALFLVYNFWYSRFGRSELPTLAVGAPLPDFAVETIDGRPVTSANFRGHPSLLIFYRGNWCPLCMAQIKEVAADYADLAKAGVEIALISPQSHEQTRSLAQRFDVPFRFLVDRGNSAARKLGIEARGGVPAGMPGYAADTVMPTVIITNANGRIIFSDQTDNYRVRPEPATFREALQRAGVAV